MLGRSALPNRDQPRLTRLQQVAVQHGLRVMHEHGGALTVATAAGAHVARADASARALQVGPLRLLERTESDPPSLYDTLHGDEYPLEPDLLLVQQLLFGGLRWEERGPGDVVVSSPRRLRWPEGESALMAPAHIAPAEDAWMWEGLDPVAALGARAEGMGGAWIVDVPPLVRCAPASSDADDKVPDGVVARLERGAAEVGVELRRLEGVNPLWVVAIDGEECGLAELYPAPSSWWAPWRARRWPVRLRTPGGALDGTLDDVDLRAPSSQLIDWHAVFSTAAEAPIHKVLGSEELDGSCDDRS